MEWETELSLHFDGIRYNYQENPHRWEKKREFNFTFWGILILLAFLVGFQILPWWVLFFPVVQRVCNLHYTLIAAVTSSHPMDRERVRKEIRDIEKNGI